MIFHKVFEIVNIRKFHCKKMFSFPEGYTEIGKYAEMFHPLLERMKVKKNIVLASSSQQRKEMLDRFGIELTCVAPEKPELIPENATFGDIVKHIALCKAEEIYDRLKPDNSTIIIAADTLVTVGNKIFGKPGDEVQALQMLQTLSGNINEVYTGVAIISNFKTVNFVDSTKVYFKKLSDYEIKNYISTGECFNKAGGYAIQGLGAALIERIEGDYYTVIGLPISRLAEELKTIIEEEENMTNI